MVGVSSGLAVIFGVAVAVILAAERGGASAASRGLGPLIATAFIRLA
jgi:hypothetical protein